MTLQPNEKIKDPHAPANGEAVADISAKHSVHCGREPEHIAWCKEDFDELLCVPCVHKAKVNIHRAIHCSLVLREQPLRLVRMVENFVERVGGKFAAEHGKENAATKNWIDKTGGIACKQPSVAVQSRGAIGKIRLDVNLRHTPGACHPFGGNWLFGQCLIEKFFSAELGLSKRFAVENHSNAGALSAEWNQPEPAIDGTD